MGGPQNQAAGHCFLVPDVSGPKRIPREVQGQGGSGGLRLRCDAYVRGVSMLIVLEFSFIQIGLSDNIGGLGSSRNQVN